MTITVNNREVDWVEGESVKELLKRMRFSFPLIVVKINGELITKEKYHETKISDNDKVDAIHLISGG